MLLLPQSLHSLMMIPGAAAVFTSAPQPLVLEEATAAAVFTSVPSPLVLAEAAAAAFFALAPPSLVLAEAAAAAVCTISPPPLVFAHALPLPRATPRALLPHPPRCWVRARIRPIG